MIVSAKTVVVFLSLAFATGGTALSVLTSEPSGDGVGADAGLDDDGDGFYDWLVVEAAVTFPKSGDWQFSASLSADEPPAQGACEVQGPRPIPLETLTTPLPPEYPIAWTYGRYFFPAGTQTVRMAFAGTDINRAGVDGPYAVRATFTLGDFVAYGRLEPQSPLPWPAEPPLEWSYRTQAYRASDFDAPVRPAFFTGSHEDVGIHVDEDGLYDLFELRAAVRVEIPGRYHLSGNLASTSPGPYVDAVWSIAYAYADVMLEAGDGTVALRFRGDQIRAAGVDGPWAFSLTLAGPDVYAFGYGNVTSADGYLVPPPYYPEFLCGTTGAHSAAAFDDTMELARYTGRFEEVAEDWDADGLYDVLLIRAEIEVFLASGFDVRGSLRGPDTLHDIAGSWSQMFWSEGLAWADFAFAGTDIRASGVDGPYEATLSITPIAYGIDPTTTYVTRAYRASDFEEGGTGKLTHWIGDLGAAADAGGNLRISVTVVRGGDFLTVVIEDTLAVQVVDAAGAVLFSAAERVFLPSGGSTATFSFAVSGLAPGAYTVIAILGTADAPVHVVSVNVDV